MTKRICQLLVISAILVTSFASVGGASAWSGCSSYVTVQWGDTLSGIAVQCGTTVRAIQAANPGLGWRVYAGQVLYIPTGYTSAPVSYPTYNTYMVQWGDTLGKIAAKTGNSVAAILAANPQIWDPSLIYAGQVINLPAGMNIPPPVYNPPPANPNCNCPPPQTGSFSSLKINFKPGLFVRTAPDGTIIASALDKTTWYYRPSSIFMDKHWKVWVEVKLYPPVKGYSTGWMLVKDQLGKYFTDPPLDQHIDP